MRMRWSALGFVLLGLMTACGEPQPSTSVEPGTSESTTSGPSLGWTKLPESPLSPREGVAVARVGGEVVFVGGYAGPPCPPNADCEYPEDAIQRDGAAYHLGSSAWRRIADAPQPIPARAPAVGVGEKLYVVAKESLLIWDGATDTWSEAEPPRPLEWGRLIADGTRLVMAPDTDENGIRPDQVYDTTTGDWSILPKDPFKPAFDRMITSTSSGLVLTAKLITPSGDIADPSLVQAAILEDGVWRKLPPSDQLAGWRWAWTGQRLVEVTLGGSDGGEVDGYDRVIPYGGRLDPATGEWSRLPDAPEERTGGWPVEAGGGPLVAAEGWVYDDASEAWTKLAQPPGAPGEPGPAIWADDVLLVYGGADWEGSDEPEEWTPENVWSTDLWAFAK